MLGLTETRTVMVEKAAATAIALMDLTRVEAIVVVDTAIAPVMVTEIGMEDLVAVRKIVSVAQK